MSQKYVIVSHKNPLKPAEAPKFYAQSKSTEKVTIEKICKRISERSSFSTGELEGMVGEFLLEVKNVLDEGCIASFGRLGNFRLTLKTGTPAETEKDFRPTNVGSCRVVFHPGTQLTELCRNMKFTPYKAGEKEEDETPAGEVE